jgi:hypothetical protein
MPGSKARMSVPLAAFDRSLMPIDAVITQIRRRHHAALVANTERNADELGLHDVRGAGRCTDAKLAAYAYWTGTFRGASSACVPCGSGTTTSRTPFL